MIQHAHWHEGLTYLTICWFDGTRDHECYLEGEKMIHALDQLHAEESHEGLTRVLHKIIGEMG